MEHEGATRRTDVRGGLGAARHARATLRAAVLCAWAVAAWLVIEAARALGRRRATAARGRILRAWARGSLAVLGARVDVEGEPPSSPCLLVANHLSYVDVAVLWAVLPCRFLAKADVAAWPGIGFLARRCGTLFVRREARRELPRSIDDVRAALDAGEIVAIFPEGTSGAGDRVMPFRPAFFEVAARTGAPVRHAALGYATPPGEPPATDAVCWWGGVSFGAHLQRLLALKGFRATIAFGPDALALSDRKELARRAHAAVSARFRPVAGARAGQ